MTEHTILPDGKISQANFNAVLNLSRKGQGSNANYSLPYGSLYKRPMQRMVMPSSIDESKHDFGMKISGATVILYSGSIFFQTMEPLYHAGGTYTMLGAGCLYIAVDKLTYAVTVEQGIDSNPAHYSGIPSDATRWVKSLASFANTDAGIKMMKRHYLGGAIWFETPAV